MTTHPKPRRTVPAIHVSNRAAVPVRVQYRDKQGAHCYPEFVVEPKGSHVTIWPAGFEDAWCVASRPRVGRLVTVQTGFWFEGGFYLMPETLPATPAATS